MDPAHEVRLAEMHRACTAGGPSNQEELRWVGDIFKESSDQRAYDIIAAGYRHSLIQHALDRGGTLEDAEDAVEAALVELYYDHRSIRQSVRGWLYRVVSNIAIGGGRGRQRRRRRETLWAAEAENDALGNPHGDQEQVEVSNKAGLTLAQEKALNMIRELAGEEEYQFLIDCHSLTPDKGKRISWVKLINKYGGTFKELRNRYQALVKRLARHSRGHKPDDNNE
jgi:DNA-directed RNA polymerase specialized sigma24 family protein